MSPDTTSDTTNDNAPDATAESTPETTTTTRIRDAALHEFGERGVAGATMKSIAERAGVSAQLVVHHFGSKRGIAAACDEYVVAQFREYNTSLMASGGAFSRQEKLSQPWLVPAIAYFAARLADDSPAVADLVDDAVEDALVYFAKGEEAGMIKPTAHPRERVVLIMMWQLGALSLHRHVKRLLGVDLVAGDMESLTAWSAGVSELLTEGLFHKEAMEKRND